MSSIKIRTKRINGNTQIRMLITHPMHNGRIKDKKGKLIPAHHIQQLFVDHNGINIITSHMGGSISKNPYFDFLLKGGESGDKITVSWEDNRGHTDTMTHIIN